MIKIKCQCQQLLNILCENFKTRFIVMKPLSRAQKMYCSKQHFLLIQTSNFVSCFALYIKLCFHFMLFKLLVPYCPYSIGLFSCVYLHNEYYII